MKNYKLFLSIFFLWAVIGIIRQSQFGFWAADIEVVLKYTITVFFIITLFFKGVVFENSFFRRILLLGLFILIQTLVFEHSHPLTCLNTIISACWWVFPSYLFYWITIRLKDNALNIFKKYFVRLLIVEVIMFFVLYFLVMEDRVQSNMIYWSALLIPYLFLIPDYARRNLLVIAMMLVVAFSLKRSAFIYGTFAILLIIWNKWSVDKNLLRALIFVIFMTTLAFAFFSISESMENSTISRFENFSEGGDVRSDIYEIVWEKFLLKTPMEKFFGNGYQSTLFGGITEDLGFTKTAHDDFLEVLCDYGIIGLIIYILLIVRIIKTVIKSRKIDNKVFLVNLQVLATFIVMSTISHLIIYPSYFAFLTAWWGINEGLLANKQKGVVAV